MLALDAGLGPEYFGDLVTSGIISNGSLCILYDNSCITMHNYDKCNDICSTRELYDHDGTTISEVSNHSNLPCDLSDSDCISDYCNDISSYGRTCLNGVNGES